MSAECDFVASRTSIKETCADMDRETVVSSFFGSVSKGKRDRDQNVVQTLEADKMSTTSLNGKRRKNWLSEDFSKLRQTRRLSTGRRQIQILLFMRSISYSYNRLINGLIRIRETKNKLVWRIGIEE